MEGAVCVILHNMIIDMGRRGILNSERDEKCNLLDTNELLQESFEEEQKVQRTAERCTALIDTLLGFQTKYSSEKGFNSLKDLLIDLQWRRHGRTASGR